MTAEVYLVATGAVLAAHDATTRRLPDRVVVGSYPIEPLLLLLLLVASALGGAWGALGRAGIGAVALGGFFSALALVFPGQ